MRKTVLLANTPSNTRAIAAALTKAPRTESEKPSDCFFLVRSIWIIQLGCIYTKGVASFKQFCTYYLTNKLVVGVAQN